MPREKIVDVTFKVFNAEDFGDCGFWALDDAEVHLVIEKIKNANYFVSVKVKGEWKTIRGALTPEPVTLAYKKFCGSVTDSATVTEELKGKCKRQKIDGSGTFINLIYGFLPCDAKIKPLKGCLDPIDLGGTFKDLLLPKDEQKGTKPLSSIIESIIGTKTSFIPATYEAKYYYNNNLLLVQTSSGNSGTVYLTKRSTN